jgi:hypothetical protein
MTLLITASARGQQCADSFEAATGEETHWAQNLEEAAIRGREQTYTDRVIDQFLTETEPEESEQMIDIGAPLFWFTSTSESRNGTAGAGSALRLAPAKTRTDGRPPRGHRTNTL